MNNTTGAIILAAGASSRLGKSKQLLRIGGLTFLQQTISVAKDAGIDHIFVVLGANAEQHQESIKDRSVQVVRNNNWQAGMGSSIKLGLKSMLAANNKLESVILLVCDQPALTAVHLNLLRSTYEKSKKGIVASRYADTTGVPVLFSKTYYDSILKISDSEGAKAIFQQYPSDTAIVDFAGGEHDIDTLMDIEKFNSRTTNPIN
jgi:molybdenum cofactor cytidylyltransferase